MQAGVALACKGTEPRGREGVSGAQQHLVAVAAAGAAGDGEIDVVECENEDGEVRACGEDPAYASENLVDGSLGLCSARGEREVCERGERRGRSAAEPGERGGVQVRHAPQERLAKVHWCGSPQVVEHQRARTDVRGCSQPVRVCA